MVAPVTTGAIATGMLGPDSEGGQMRVGTDRKWDRRAESTVRKVMPY